MSARNKKAGDKYELWFIKAIKSIWPKAGSSRNESRALDAKKVDVINTFPFQFQLKLQKNYPDIRILDQMPEGNNVIVWGKTEKAEKNFIKKGDYAIMKLDLFLDLIKENEENKPLGHGY
jgi:hypothetical protein